jgi:hypothetical protein
LRAELQLVAAATLAACQPWVYDPGEPPCERVRPEIGAHVVDAIRCSDLTPPGGEGRVNADLYLANREWRAVIRNPLDALTVPGLAGGTVVDAAPWNVQDTVHEAVPIVGGGWLTSAELAIHADGFTLTGPVGPLPGLPPPAAAGEIRSVRYRVEPDSPALRAEGAQGWWIHPRGDAELLDGVAVAEGRAVGAAGLVTDLGGAFAVWGSDRLVIATDVDVWGDRAAQAVRVSGEAPGAATIALFRRGVRVGRVPILTSTSSFSFLADAEVDAVRAEAPGFAPSASAAPGTELSLSLGARGSLVLDPRWSDGLPHWFRAQWNAVDGRAGEQILGPEGGAVALGAGVYDVTLSAGPAFAVVQVRIEVPPDEDVLLPIRLPVRIAAGPHVLAGFRRPADRSRDWRGSDLTAALEAAADGLVYATFTPDSDVPAVSPTQVGFPRLRVRNGVLLQGDGYSVASWSWGASTREALHGGPRLGPADAQTDARVLEGGPDDARSLHVDLGWLARVGAPFTVDTELVAGPALVALGHPGPNAAAWAPWLTWLDAHRPIVPTGPATWVRVTSAALVGHQDVEQSLARGAVCAGNGPRITVTVDGVAPGDQVPPPPDTDSGDTGDTGDTGSTAGTAATSAPTVPPVRRLVVSVAPLDRLQHLVVLGSDGEQTALPLLGEVTVDLHPAGSWVAVAAWSDDEDGPWAVTGPVWLLAP